ncbi:MAG: crossover junction endodeoxyribonuclease RuvC [Clostridia bacterium]|jgi:crossover junction endodeoxyribonuclease RuvC|nr:crossover junction endodeoxyribonuclease RuvC [Clostridia bacterium]MDD4571412.1 crossover junction endodeoxyribonuclease RuvC [Clostridia bacterium]
MRILGIDPGTAITGYGILDKHYNNYKVVDYGCIRTSAVLDMPKRIMEIYNGILWLIQEFKPDEVAVEELFFNRNTTTALTVGQARGVILLAASQKNLNIGEYTPLQVKQAIAGYGKAEKKQVQFMVKTILKLPEIPKPDDVADALAIAICHGNWQKGNNIIGR